MVAVDLLLLLLLQISDIVRRRGVHSCLVDIHRALPLIRCLWMMGRGSGGGVGGGLPGGELGELVNGGFGLPDEPVDGLARAVVTEPVLDVIELDGGVGRQPHAAVPRPLGGAHLAVPVLPPGGPNNVASLDLHDLSSTATADAAAASPHSQS